MFLCKHIVLHAILQHVHDLLTFLTEPLSITVLFEVMSWDWIQILKNVLLCNLASIQLLNLIRVIKHQGVELIDLSPIYLSWRVVIKFEEFAICHKVLFIIIDLNLTFFCIFRRPWQCTWTLTQTLLSLILLGLRTALFSQSWHIYCYFKMKSQIQIFYLYFYFI